MPLSVTLPFKYTKINIDNKTNPEGSPEQPRCSEGLTQRPRMGSHCAVRGYLLLSVPLPQHAEGTAEHEAATQLPRSPGTK